MPAVSAAVHKLQLKFGVYSAASQRTCGNWSASMFREVADATTFAKDWQIDYLKYDSCIYNSGVASRARYLAMSRALNATGRKIFYSVEGWDPEQGNWGPELANMWRTGNGACVPSPSVPDSLADVLLKCQTFGLGGTNAF